MGHLWPRIPVVIATGRADVTDSSSSVIEMFLGKVLEPRRVNLKCRVVYEHIEPAKFTQRLSNNLVAKEDGAAHGNSGTAFSFKLNC